MADNGQGLRRRLPVGPLTAHSEDRFRYRIGVNLTWLVPGVVGGSEEYTIRLLKGMGACLPSDIGVQLYARGELIEQYPELVERYSIVRCPTANSKPARVALEQTWLANASRGDDIVHHAGGTVPYVRLRPGIVTIHDLQPLDMPENFDAVKRRWLHHALPYAVRAARLVLCPSEFTARRLRDLLDVDGSRIRVVLHGHSAKAQSGPQGAASSDPVERFGRYLLYPAIAYPHKRHVDVVRAVAGLGQAFADLNVVFTGRPGPELASVLGEAAKLGIGDRVHAIGRVPEVDLDALYRSAQALVFPSAYEGFGNPALEAMSAGCPVIASDGGALPEVIGDAGLQFPVGDVLALAGAISDIVGDPVLADAIRTRGLARAARFDSGIAAEQLAAVYCELADTGPN
ncbi:MAG: glycosyltransferase family 4 protein [Acidimicrobiales bacterium]